MCVDMWVDMRVGMCVDAVADMCIHMCQTQHNAIAYIMVPRMPNIIMST